MKNLFIDTNVFLNFYHFTNDDLQELEKLVLFVRQGEIKLYVTDQVVKEFRRNRANKIADAVKKLQDQKLNFAFPQISKDYKQYEEMREFQKEYSKNHAELIKIIKQDFHDNKLKADLIVDKLFDISGIIDVSRSIIEKARLRVELGNPPGKKGSLGDAINWEILIEKAPNLQDFYLISENKDFCSPMDNCELDPFLLQEWEDIKVNPIHFYRQLSSFFEKHYPNIELETEQEKDKLIEKLFHSATFYETHQLIAQLSNFDDFTIAQKEEIAKATISNDQINWIINDEDIKSFLITNLKSSEYDIDYKILLELNEYFGEEVFDPIPF